jgi:hypothetical protein
MRKKTVYALRLRLTDKDEWGEANYYRTVKERNRAASISRIIGGFRTYSFNEKKSSEEIGQLEFQD